MSTKRVLLAAMACMVAFAVVGCQSADTDSADESPDSGTLAPVQIDPTAPADNAQETVDDANAVIDEQATEVQELTDTE